MIEDDSMNHVRRPQSRKRVRSMAIGIVLLLAAGCKPEDDITKTTEPRDHFARPEAMKPPPKSEKTPLRILGLMALSSEGQSWFFKLQGPPDSVAKEESAFDDFVSSIEFTAKPDKPVVWTLPPGWREGPKTDRYATIFLGPKDDPIELSVRPLGGELAGDLLANVNRWRTQVGLPDIKQDALESCCHEVTTKQGKKVMRVDVTGVPPAGPAMPPFMRGN